MERSLELLTIDTEEPVQTINFGSTYYGTDLTQSFLIYNNGPAIAHFVVILEEGGEGQEVVCTMYSVQYAEAWFHWSSYMYINILYMTYVVDRALVYMYYTFLSQEELL